jgi:A/G-specific adenine glycosylase
MHRPAHGMFSGTSLKARSSSKIISASDTSLPAQKRACATGLLDWFEREQRDLPWRKNRTPYRVWVSELMLQQTRVDQVVPYYLRWMRRFPSLKSLADAPQQDVLKVWEGLGYYARARNLHRAAQHIRENHSGRFPRNYTDLLALPGIGPYTAAAIASLAYNEDVAVLDGNLYRVLSRLYAGTEDVSRPASRKIFQARADELLPRGRAGEFNEAMMELGAIICTPRQPSCERCPLRKVCSVRQQQLDPQIFPRKQKKAKVPTVHVGAAVLQNRKGEVLIAQRRQNQMLGGLWEFPGGKREPDESIEACIARELKEELGVTIEVGPHLMEVRHAYSHFKLIMQVHFGRILRGRPRPIECADYRWCTIDALDDFPFSKADLHVIDRLRQNLKP